MGLVGRVRARCYGLARRDYAPPDDLADDFESWQPPLARLPRTRAEVIGVFGDPGVGRSSVNPGWERRNMVVARDLPAIPRGRLYVHRLAEPYLREALRRVELVAPGEIWKIGCFAFRRQRHDPRRPLSLHAFGIAVDINPRDNRAVTLPVKPRPLTDDWRELWPHGVTGALVGAFRATGWSWGGDWPRFVDPMHFELTAPRAA